MLSWRNRAAVGAAAGVLVAGLGGAAATTLPASGAPTVHVRKFVSVQVGHNHRLGKSTFVSSDVERHNGQVIGTDSITGKFYFKQGVARIYVAVAWKGGALIIHGHGTQNTPFVGKIVRGTGKYAGAQGTVTTRDLGHNRTAVKVVYTL